MLDPITEAGSGSVQEKEKAWLSEIIEQLNTLFGSDTTEGDQLSYANAVAEKTLESEVLQKQAANNSKEQFANSPDLTSEILTETGVTRSTAPKNPFCNGYVPVLPLIGAFSADFKDRSPIQMRSQPLPSRCRVY